jgi:ferredoxin
MPKVTAQGKTFECPVGSNLRQVLLDNQIDLYNGAFKVLNCHGLGTCGTCTVQVEGEVSPVESPEKIRRSLPPHSLAKDRRLSCQTKVLGDLKVTKYSGGWGEKDEVVWSPLG